MEESTDEESNQTPLLADLSTVDSQSEIFAKTKDAHIRIMTELASQERGEKGYRDTGMKQEKLPKRGSTGVNAKGRFSSDVRADLSAKGNVPCPRTRATSLTASLDIRRTEQQLSKSRSKYEILQSGNQTYHSISFPPSLLASINSKRVQNQRGEQIRRDRLKQALQTLADMLPHKPGAQNAASIAGSRDISKAEVVENAIVYIRELHKKYGIETDAEKGAVDLDKSEDKQVH